MRIIAVIILLALIGCNGNGPPPPPPECDVWSTPDGCDCPPASPFAPLLGVCAPPRVDRPIDWNLGGGITAFSLALRDVTYIKEFTYEAQRKGWTILRVGAQTAHDWCNFSQALDAGAGDVYDSIQAAGYLPCGPAHGTAQADQNLRRLLDTTARIHNVWVQLIPTFTYKSHNEGTQAKNIVYFNRMFDHVNAIVKEGDYKHVVYELFNEVVHPLSQHIKDEDVREMFLLARARTSLPLGTDYHGGGEGNDWRGRYPFIWRDVSHYLAFHTPRNPEPSFGIMLDAQEKYRYAKPVLVDETVAWASQTNIERYGLQGKGTIAMNGYGTEEERMAQVLTHLRNIYKVKNVNGNSWIPFYHSIWGITCNEIGRMPHYDEVTR